LTYDALCLCDLFRLRPFELAAVIRVTFSCS